MKNVRLKVRLAMNILTLVGKQGEFPLKCQILE